jgi:predicted protein tyrosine phosphatase
MGWDVAHSICGLEDLPWHCRPGTTHAVSILDPDCGDPRLLNCFPFQDRLVLRFHDIINPARCMIAPKRGHIELLLAFGRRLPRDAGTKLLVHCHGGVSRSTAAAAGLLLQAHPDVDEDDLLHHIASIRPQAWPNSRMIAFADEILQRDGRLVDALRRFYGRRLRSTPNLHRRLRMGGRGGEVEMAA